MLFYNHWRVFSNIYFLAYRICYFTAGNCLFNPNICFFLLEPAVLILTPDVLGSFALSFEFCVVALCLSLPVHIEFYLSDLLSVRIFVVGGLMRELKF